jgi:PrtD family type I secretion system ABC transporter
MVERPTLRLFPWLRSVAKAIPNYIVPILLFSIVSNLLLLVSPFYMLQVYDRILTSGSIDTLIWLTVISVFLLIIYGAAEVGRRRLSTLAAIELDDRLSDNTFLDFAERPEAGADLPTNLREMARLRGYFANQAILPFFDLPFAPLFLAVLFVIHPLIGVIGLVGASLMVALAVSAEGLTRDAHDDAIRKDSQAFELALGLSRQRSAIVSMGLTENALSKWRAIKSDAQDTALSGGKREIGFAASSRSIRQMLQILVLGAGGALAVQQQVSPGAIVAGSIILGRALGPIDQIVGGWRNIASVRQARAAQIDRILPIDQSEPELPLPRPEAVVLFDRLAVATPGAEAPLVRPFKLSLSGGNLVTLIGPIGSGKTSLLQTVSGAWRPFSGHVFLGGRDIHAWSSDDRGPYVGYVPQHVELLPGSVAQNIARMSECEAEDVIDAAQRAGAHEMILGLPDGYNTPVGVPGIASLSSGQRQLIGLARALFGHPVLLILDEPTANLDLDAGRKTIAALRGAADAGAIVLVATHDLGILRAAQSVLAIRDGGVVAADTKRYLESLEKPETSKPTGQLA